MDGDDGSGLESGRGDEIVMWSWRVLGGAERAGVDDGALKGASRTFLFHFVGGGREDLCDAAGSVWHQTPKIRCHDSYWWVTLYCQNQMSAFYI